MAINLAFTLLLASSALAAPAPAASPQWGGPGWGWGPVPGPGFPGSCPTPSNLPGFYDDRLPDPFLFDNGTPVRSLSDWACRRSQIGALIQGYEAGALPGKPQHVSATYSRVNNTGNLTISAGWGNNLISWSNAIKYPNSSVPMPRGGWPLTVAYDGLSIPVPENVAVLTYPNSLIAQQNSNPASRGVGLFYNLYGNVSASAMTAWVWGASRIIDSLEMTPAAQINTGRMAVTGCSRDGKGALMAGAFETRFALTIPQESGSGGDTCWRLSKYEQDSGDVVQQATEIVGENVWFSENFNNYVYNLSVLPYDHHELAGMVAPRGLISYENTDFEWLSPLSSYGCMTAAHTIYTAMGVPNNHGFVEVGNHSHCYFPPALEDSLFAFFDKFLLDEQNVDTDYFSTNGRFNGTVWDANYWINWTTPRLTWW